MSTVCEKGGELHYISLKGTPNRIVRKFHLFNILNQNVIFIINNCTVLGTQIKRYACNLHLNEQRDTKIVSNIFHRVYLQGSRKYEMIFFNELKTTTTTTT